MYYTPNGDYIEHVGLKPNVVDVEPTGVASSDIPRQDSQWWGAITVLDHMIEALPSP